VVIPLALVSRNGDADAVNFDWVVE